MQSTFAFSSQLNFRSKREAKTEKHSRNMSLRTLDCVTEILQAWFALEREQKKCQLRWNCVWESDPKPFRCTSLLRTIASLFVSHAFRSLCLRFLVLSSFNLKLCCTEHTKISLFVPHIMMHRYLEGHDDGTQRREKADFLLPSLTQAS